MSRGGPEGLYGRGVGTAICVTTVALLLAALLLLAGAPLNENASGKPRGGDGNRRSVLWAVGDGADGGSAGQAVATMIAGRRVDRFLYLGDVYESGTALEFETNYRPLFGRFDAIAAPTIGNHEWPNVETGYLPYWTAVWGTPPPFWYVLAASGWQLISLNSNEPSGEGSAQLAWLRDQLAANAGYGNCRIVFMHHPVFSAGLHGDTPSLQPLFTELEGDASIVLAGHDHDMQRLHPIGGITQLVSGAGGRRLYAVNRADPRLAFADDVHYGALRLELRPERAKLSFVATDGTLLDRSALRCREGSASP
jgi:acid phosphatase type 7